MSKKQIIIFDTELIGKKKPVFFVGCKNITTGKTLGFWEHKRGHMAKLEAMLLDPTYTWVGFISENFDRPLLAAAVMGHDASDLKTVATAIIEERMRSWQTYKEFNLDFLEYDHIDLFDVAPGVMTSLKTYMGRMGYPTMQDLPFHHDKDLTVAEQAVLEKYCLNDLGGTDWLMKKLQDELTLREEMSEEYGIDLRSKSDAQVAEAILKKKVGIKNGEKHVPSWVNYITPKFIKTDHPGIKEMIDLIEDHDFIINKMTGSPSAPDFMEEPLRINEGFYQVGIGGLHSTHDKNMYLEATKDQIISDFDVTSYYPNIMINAGLIPRLGGNKGQVFLDEYRKIYEARVAAKRSGNKKVANSLKITLNGTFGKLGSIFCSFYSPDLMLAVTITGQLNLLCLIHEVEKIKGVKVRSANTDGIVVVYPPKARKAVLKVFAENSKRTGFDYEETQYLKYAAKDVNNYVAVKKKFDKATGEWLMEPDGTKGKGLYAEKGLMKNPTMQVYSDAVAQYLIDGTKPEDFIPQVKTVDDFMSIRNVKGGGIQHKKYVMLDDWVQVEHGRWRRPCWPAIKADEKRVSRPKPVQVGVGGEPFGRVARWYMTKDKLPALTSMGGEIKGKANGSQIPKTEGARVCMTLPDKLPKDLNIQWYIDEAYSMLTDMGVQKSL